MRRVLRKFGFLAFNHSYQNIIWNVQNYFFFILMIPYLLSIFWYFVFDAKTFSEYSESFFYWFSSFIGCLMYRDLISDRIELVNILYDIESIIQKRKPLSFICIHFFFIDIKFLFFVFLLGKGISIYNSTIENIEKWTRICEMVPFIMFAFHVTPNLIPSYYKYYFTDSADESFLLMVPAM